MDHALLESFYEVMESTGGLGKVRAKSWSRFSEAGLPHKKLAPFRYLPLRSLYAQKPVLPSAPMVDFEAVMGAVLPECAESFLVFINGIFVPGLSNLNALQSLRISPLSEAQSAYGTFLQNRIQRLMKGESDPFAHLNGALHTDGAFLYIPPGTVVEAPIQILHVVDGEGTLLSPRVHLYAGADAQVELVSTLTTPHPFWMNGLLDLAIEENANIKLTSLHEAPYAILFNSVRASLKRDSRLKAVLADCGGKSSRHDFKASLLEENAEVSLYGAFCLAEQRQAHANLVIEHLAPHCRSTQLFKSLLTDTSRASFVGKIWVDKEAQKTDAFQLNNTLLLSDQAIAYSEPNLEIFADDVKASHGSTIGQLGEEELFYLRSRGVATKEAKRLLVEGFIGEVAKEMNPSCQNRIAKWIHV